MARTFRVTGIRVEPSANETHDHVGVHPPGDEPPADRPSRHHRRTCGTPLATATTSTTPVSSPPRGRRVPDLLVPRVPPHDGRPQLADPSWRCPAPDARARSDRPSSRAIRSVRIASSYVRPRSHVASKASLSVIASAACSTTTIVTPSLLATGSSMPNITIDSSMITSLSGSRLDEPRLGAGLHEAADGAVPVASSSRADIS